MAIVAFPPVSSADENGLLAVGGDLEVESLILAYRSGIFPWPIVGIEELVWFAPPERAILFLNEFHLSRKLAKLRLTSKFRFEIDSNFSEVIRHCAESDNRRGQGTWLTADVQSAYIELHRAGYAHSVECYDSSELVGGLYGVSICGMFAGESMFYKHSGASKLALAFLVDYLKLRGATWIDCQVMTPHLAALGAKEVKREVFMEMLSESLKSGLRLFS